MSGIVGIFRRNGAPVERPLLSSLTNFLSYRGPDAEEVWCEGSIGFGHTMLRTTRQAARECQPVGLAGRFWITADVRLDCRGELIEALREAGCQFDDKEIIDPELILHSYASWRERCVERLRGDFAFALWDAAEKRLFCARDHFGIKPFFYVVREDQFLFSNTLNCLRAHPDVSDELNDAAIGDFLLFGLNCDVATTTFRDIQRLPPAHFLAVSAAGVRTERYWSPPIDGRIRYSRPEDYVENFREILKASVADRLRTDRVGIFLSGGLDSGSIAAMARELSSSAACSRELQAVTKVFKSLIQDDEGIYARETARFLQIPIESSELDGMRPFDRWDDAGLTSPEPADTPFFAALVDDYQQLKCRVFLSGEGGDYLTYFQMLPYATDLLKHGEWGTFAAEFSKFLWVRPFPWKGIRYRVSRVVGLDSSAPVFPDWIASNFAKRLHLAERWRGDATRGVELHPLLPKAYAALTTPYWNLFFELEDPGVTRSFVEVRYPFLDLRVVDYLLSIPPFPWLFDKKIFREAMQKRLPESIRLRPKAPLSGDPLAAVFGGPYASWLRKVSLGEEVRAYVDPGRFSQLPENASSEQIKVVIRAICLNFWLQSALRVRYKLNVEGLEWISL